MRTRGWVWVAASVMLALVATTGMPASADTKSDKKKVDAALERVEKDLRKANAKVSQAERRLTQARKELPGARAALEDARQEAAAAAAADARAREALEEATAAAERAQRERVEMEARIADMQGRVGNLARRVYQAGSLAAFELLLASDSPTELADRAAAIDAVSRANNQSLTQMRLARTKLALAEARLEALRIEIRDKRRQAAAALQRATAARARATAAKGRVDELVAQRAQALEATAKERARVRKRYKELEAEQRRIARLLARQAAREAARRAAGQGLGFTPTSSSGFVWPVPGARLTQGVGPRVHPVYGYRSCHTGIDLGAPSGTPIRSTAAGVIVANSYYGPFGRHTLISHGDGLYSLYAHQSRFATSVGQSVSAGQVIGYVGSTGYSTGPHLHFEIRIGGTPYNPMGWFGGARTPVSC